MDSKSISINELNSSLRLNWIDQVKGFTIFLVVYGHNFPDLEKYIYSYHMPLFIMIAGFFHPTSSNINSVKKRFKTIILPYFFWGLSLFVFWYLIGRKYGENLKFELSPLKNFIGIFYSQGGREYMDWGIPLWYLPAIFMMFVLFSFLQKISNAKIFLISSLFVVSLGFAYTRFFNINLPWSVNIAMVGLFFYFFGNQFLDKINHISKNKSIVLMLIMGVLNLILFSYNIKIDMYRAIYGNEFLFILNGITGSIFILLFFKNFPIFSFLSFIGKFTIVILALQLFALTFIKFILLVVFKDSDFNFNEIEKFVYAILQIIVLIPSFYIINKYFPILNGGYKKI